MDRELTRGHKKERVGDDGELPDAVVGGTFVVAKTHMDAGTRCRID
jgi:hypothetical protein